MSQKPHGINGKVVVLCLLLAGTIVAIILSRNIPRHNPKQTEPGSPYYSPPTAEELKAEKAFKAEEELKAIREEEQKAKLRNEQK
jgi:hypothetical protein